MMRKSVSPMVWSFVLWGLSLCAWAGQGEGGRGRMLGVLQFNFQNANRYSLQGEKQGKSVEDAVVVIRHFSPDLMTLCEVSKPYAEQIAQQVQMEVAFADWKNPSGIGTAVFSSTPILSHEQHNLPGSDLMVCMEITTRVDGQLLHFYGAHPRFNNHEAKPAQMLGMMNLLGATPGPKILIGDFNDMDCRPNWYSSTGYINLLTGGAQGSYLPSAPKLYDFHRKCAPREHTRNDPPYYTPATDWEPPYNQANTISQWAPKVRIDHIFVSPEFYLDDPRNTCITTDTWPILEKEGAPEDGPRAIGDHRPLFARILLPKPPVRLILFPDADTLALPVGASYDLKVGAVDEDGNPVSLYENDTQAPQNDPAATGRIRSAVSWKLESEGVAEARPEVYVEGYDPYLKYDRPSAPCVHLKALAPGETTITATVAGVSQSLKIKVIPAGELYQTEEDEARKYPDKKK